MVMEGFVERGRSSQGRVPMCSLKFRSNTCVCYCFYCGRMFTILFKCLIDKTNREIELYALLVLFKCLIIHIKLVGFVNKMIAPLSSACTFTSFGVHENVKLQPTTIGVTCIVACKNFKKYRRTWVEYLSKFRRTLHLHSSNYKDLICSNDIY